MIVGTAGHIDHGKSTLVQALTGTDPSRLPEEKRRGMSIELGYAFLDTPGGERIGFIDVPGHERLVHTMLAGATGLDAVMLLIAADDGVMPQTREHLAVISLLGIGRGAVVVTKIDRVPGERVAEVIAQARVLIERSSLADAPVFSISAISGDGVDDVRAWLLSLPGLQADARGGRSTPAVDDSKNSAAARQSDTPLQSATASDSPDRVFRMAIDRSFTLAGIGTVVTGTVHAGQAHVGDDLTLAPDGAQRRAHTRVRSVHAQNRRADVASVGQRCALNVAGLSREDVPRGAWLCGPEAALTTDRIDVLLTLWSAEDKSLRSGTPVHLHAGAADVMARLVLLEGDSLAPGASAIAQLILQAPIAIWRGDRIVLRDASATRTLAGGRVLDPFAPTRYRQTPQRLASLRAMSRPAIGERLREALQHAPHGLDVDQWLRAEGLSSTAAAALAEPAQALIVDAGGRTTGAEPTRWIISTTAWTALRQSLLDAVDAFHLNEADALGVEPSRLRRLAAPRASPTVIDHAVRTLLASGELNRHGVFLHRPDHLVTLAPAEQQLAQKILPRLTAGAYDPPWVRDLARDLIVPETQVRQTLSRMAVRGEVFQVVRDLYYATSVIERLATVIRDIADQSDSRGVEAARFRDQTGLGRKRAIQILEFFDRVGLLRRVRDSHLLRPGTSMFESAPLHSTPSGPGTTTQP